MRTACAGLPFYEEREGKRYCVLHAPDRGKRVDFDKAVQQKLRKNDFNFQGVRFSDEVSFSNVTFAFRANFRSATFSEKADFSGATFIEEADFGGATFGAVANFSAAIFRVATYFRSSAFIGTGNFRSTVFKGPAYFGSASFSAGVHFTGATFNAVASFKSVTFGARATFFGVVFSAETNFKSASFSAETNFRSTKFSANASFKGVDFSSKTHFNGASFQNASFRYSAFLAPVDFGHTIFSGMLDLKDATFREDVKFAGDRKRRGFSSGSSLDLQFATIQRPGQVLFHTLTLRPHWFINTDASKFDFANVNWDWEGIDREVQSLEERGISAPYSVLAVDCRNLAVNAEENHRYEEASRFRYVAMDARRRETWHGFAFWKLSWWYWLASGYGERVLQAFLVLLGIWLVAGLLYTQVGFARWEPKLASETDVVAAKRDDVGTPLKFSRALTYSAGVMTLQKPEPRPATTAAQTVVLFETILGPVQAALLALAIRRKFMR